MKRYRSKYPNQNIKCYKYKIESAYFFQGIREGNGIKDLNDSQVKNTEEVFNCLENIEIYIPVDKNNFEEIINWIKATTIDSKLKPGRKDLIQYLVNYQIVQCLERCLDRDKWEVEMEPYYEIEKDIKGSLKRADVKILLKKLGITIWLESDDKREDQIFKKLWQKMGIIGKYNKFKNDIFCTFIYTTTPSATLKTSKQKKQKNSPIHTCFKNTQASIKDNIEGNNLRGSYVVMALVEQEKQDIGFIDLQVVNNTINIRKSGISKLNQFKYSRAQLKIKKSSTVKVSKRDVKSQ